MCSPDRKSRKGREWITLEIYTDGGARGNPGHAAFAYLIRSNGEILEERSEYIGFATNNEAEYSGLIAALNRAKELGAEMVNVVMDSELVVRQMRGEYRVRAPNLRPLAKKAQELAMGFENISFTHVNRDHPMIKRVDALLNRKLDEHILLKKLRKE